MQLILKSIFTERSWIAFSEHVNNANCCIDQYILDCRIIKTDEFYFKIATSQDFCLSFELSKAYDNEAIKDI
ncbi:MAG: hypothetical protein CVU05_14340 [Bacteroidetes bacterium HGW-Bacteroidetes-21]|nr:MAG: hypothetical protein CVU05_14340 [Bacteroidetes bacterium HGW-Bacteroidetes-21]